MSQSKIYFLPYEKLNDFLHLLSKQFKIIGPTLKNNLIHYQEITSSDDLPRGYVAQQGSGHYALKKTNDLTYFSWVNSMFAVKPILFKPKELLWKVMRDNEGQLQFIQTQPKPEKLALFGIRPCDLKAILIQDEVFLNSSYEDPLYKTRRHDNFIVVANCSLSSNNCFCVAMGDQPKAEKHFDIAITEIEQGFLFEAGSESSASYPTALNLQAATTRQIKAGKQAVLNAANMQTKKIQSKDLQKDLFNNLNHPYWDKVAKDCLSCGNCTQVCPTCFCHNEIEQPELNGESSEHARVWGSCFTKEHSYIHGKTIRKDTKSRYRQWLTHKFGSWQQQFGTNGCVGCGRCISWCPTGIDVTEVLNHVTQDTENDEI